VKPIRLSFKNFNSYGDELQEIDFVEGYTTLVMGDNGAGKSTFFDAMLWCLYGKTSGSVESVVNRTNKKNCMAEMEFFSDSDKYCITRYRKDEEHGNNVYVYKNDENITPTKKQEVQQKIDEDIIGMNFEAMTSSTIFSEEIYKPLLSLPNLKRLKVFEGILSLKEINKWSVEIKKNRKPILEEIENRSYKINTINSSIETTKKNAESYKKNAKEKIIEIKKEVEKLEEEKKTLEKSKKEFSILNIKEEKEKNLKNKEAVKKNKTLNEDINVLNKRLDEVKSKLTNMQEEFSDISEKLDVSSKIDIDEELEKIRKNKDIKKINSEIDSVLEQYESFKESIKKTVKSKEGQINAIEEEIKKAEEILTEVEKGFCPYCQAPIKSDTKEEKISEAKEQLNSKKETKQSLEKELEKERAEIKNKEELIEKEKEKKSKLFLERHEENYLLEIKENLTTLKERKKVLENSFEETEKRKKELEKDVKDKKSFLIDEPEKSQLTNEELEEIDAKIEEMEKNLSSITNKINSLKESANGIYDKKYIEGLEEEIKEKEKEVKEEIKHLNKAEFIDKHYEYIINKFSNGDQSIKKDIVSTLIDKFNEEIVIYVDLFFDKDLEITFDKNLNETILENGEEIEAATFSSGEKKRLDLSISISLFMLIKQYFSSDNSFIVFDEILDNNLDSDGIQKVIEILNDLSAENAIYVISHKEDFKDTFEKKLMVKKDREGFSYSEFC
jgi:DNA repair exonuclease SbcCD ATPase subunit